jgi:SUF system FeS cluster assembly, SufBD
MKNKYKLDDSDFDILKLIGISPDQIDYLSKAKLKQLIKFRYSQYSKEQKPKPIANTYPIIQSSNSTAQIEHEASTGKISDQTMYYLESRGLGASEAVSLVVSGFCGEVLQKLPFEFALEARELLKISMEGSVG